MGYHRAGFEVVGVDHLPQKHYPFEFHQADALEYVQKHGREFDAIHASPPCQAYSIMRNLPWLREKNYPRLIDPIRSLMNETRRPWVIENVMGAKLASGWLCGTMFGLPFFRHRFFEAGGWFWLQPSHEPHKQRIRSGRSLAGRARDIVFSAAEDSRGKESWPGRRSEAGSGLTMSCFARSKTKGLKAAGVIMDVDWMRGDEISQAIPPAYTEFIGRQLMRQLLGVRP